MAKVCPSPSQREVIVVGSDLISPKQTTSTGGHKRKHVDHNHGGHRFKRERIVLPNRFLLGGNISDPLNLQSLADQTAERERRRSLGPGVSGVQQEDSPTTGSPSVSVQPNFNEPIEIKIPKDRRDPLNLEEKSPGASRRNRKRRRRTLSLKLSNEEETALLSLNHPTRPSSEMDILGGSISDSEVTNISGSQVRFRSPQSRLPPPASTLTATDVKLKSPTERPTSLTVKISSVQEEKSHLNRRKSGGTKVIDPIVSPVPELSGRQGSFTVAKRKSDGSVSGPTRSISPEKKLDISPTIPSPTKRWDKARRGGRSHRSRQSPAKERSAAAVAQQPEGNEKAEPKSTAASSVPNALSAQKAAKFRYGNYTRYYGYRLPDRASDPRLALFKAEWFEGKCVLDIGCNTGQVTSIVARDFHPRLITGIDIDPHLIGIARKNVRHYLDAEHLAESSSAQRFSPYFTKKLGPLAPPPVDLKPGEFPHNLIFRMGNYVLSNDTLLAGVKEEFDVILALSVTKWIHINWGDEGLKRFFKRVYANLRPNGVFILEPQPLPSYLKKKNVTPEGAKNFAAMKFKPDQFTEFLLSRDVGFSTSEVIGMPHTNTKGFSRPVYLFRKMELGTTRPAESTTIEHTVSTSTTLGDAGC